MSSKNILAIDTAMSGCSACVYSAGGNKYVSESEAMPRGQAEHLVPMIERVLEKAGVSYQDLGSLVTTIGPGAFTGLRIGISTAKALALALDIPVFGITTLEVLAYQYRQEHAIDDQLVVLVETKRDDFYVQIFGPDGKPAMEPKSEMAEEILGEASDSAFFIGDAVQRFRDTIETDIQIDRHFELPNPEMMVRAYRDGMIDEGVEPVYLRMPDVSQPNKLQRAIA